MIHGPQCVVDLAGAASNLPTGSSFRLLYTVTAGTGRLHLPDGLKTKVARWFTLPGDPEGGELAHRRAEYQSVVHVHNNITLEGTYYNALRALKPLPTQGATDVTLETTLEDAKRGCDFCDPSHMTSQDTWGRVETPHFVSAANVAKCQPYHGLLIFREHHPIRAWGGGGDGAGTCVSPVMEDLLNVFLGWANKSYQEASSSDMYPLPCFPVLMWNCMPKAGASQYHAHAQVLLTEVPTAPRVHCTLPDGRPYCDALVSAHQEVGLVRWLVGSSHPGVEAIAVFAYLTPNTEKELWIVAPSGSDLKNEEVRRAFAYVLGVVLHFLVDSVAVQCFNATVMHPNLVDPHSGSLYARIADRGSLQLPNDVASFELFGTGIVGTDPWTIMKAFDTYSERIGLRVLGECPGARPGACPTSHRGAPSSWVTRFGSRVPSQGTVLDVACGSGRHCEWFLQRGYHVTGIDRNITNIEDLHTMYGKSFTVIQGDLEIDTSPPPWGIDTMFDCVVVTHYLHRPLVDYLFAACSGLLIYETFSLRPQPGGGGPRNPNFLLREGELLEWIVGKDGFKVVAYEEVEAMHNGKPVFVQRICAQRVTVVDV